jgi:hypothetical protein
MFSRVAARYKPTGKTRRKLRVDQKADHQAVRTIRCSVARAA